MNALKNSCISVFLLFFANFTSYASTTTTTLVSELLTVWKTGNRATVQELIKKRAVDINQSNMDGVTPLLAACQKGLYGTVLLLLAVPGINVNQSDSNGETPLLVACKKGSYGTILNLLLDGAVNKANKKGETPLEIVDKKDWPSQSLWPSDWLEAFFVGEIHARKGRRAQSAKVCKDWIEYNSKVRKKDRDRQYQQIINGDSPYFSFFPNCA